MTQNRWARAAVSGSAAVVWLVVVACAALVMQIPSTGIRSIAGAILPAGVTPFAWSAPILWAMACPLAGAIAVGSVHAAITRAISHRTHRAAQAASLWLAAVAAGAIVGMTVDLVVVFGSFFHFGWMMWSLDLGSRAAIGAYWGLLYGWIPALVGARMKARGDLEPDSSLAGSARSVGPRGQIVAAIAAVAALVLLGAVLIGADRASQALAAENAAQSKTNVDEGGAILDPTATGEAVPERAAGAGVTSPDGCTADRSTLLIGGSDAATGHRGQVVRLTNFSEHPCTIEGYPDVAFADQNGHLLDVTVTHGRSFMGEDPGVTRVVVPAGASAITVLGWDAASTQGALVARMLFAAPLAGDKRGSWPVQLDIVAGSTVAVTAWKLDEAPRSEP